MSGSFEYAAINVVPATLRIARRSDRCTVLGPGARAVVWVQGCPFRCKGCTAPETLTFRSGTEVDIAQLARELADLPDIEGVTFSGGEPMAQAGALVGLVDLLRAARPDFGFMSYSGYTLPELRAGTPEQLALVDRLDILVDGRYVRERHTDLRWRGSDNQVVHFLTERYAHLRSLAEVRGTALEFELLKDGGLHWMGIPPPGFRQEFEKSMADLGVPLLKEKP